MDGVLQTLRIQLEAAEAARRQEAEQQRRQQEAARMAKAERLREYRLLLIEECLNIRCPRCKAVFLDFDGCLALPCGNRACGAGFCALCLAGESPRHQTPPGVRHGSGHGA